MLITALLSSCPAFLVTAQTQARQASFDPDKSIISQYGAQNADTARIRQWMDTVILFSKRRPLESIPFFNELLQLSIKQHFDFGAFNSYSNIITIYNNKGQYESAFDLMQQMHALAAKADLPQFRAAVLNSLGNYYQRKGQYDSASHYYFKALADLEGKANINPSIIPAIYGNLSGVFEHTGEYEKGLQYLQKAEPAIRTSGNTYYLALILINKGNALLKLDQADSSIPPLKEALQLAKKYEYTQWQHLALSDIAQSYFQLNDHQTALHYLQEALKLKGDIDPVYQTSNTSILGDIYFAAKDYKQAEYYWQKTLVSATELKISKSSLHAHKMLGELYQVTRQYELAYQHANSYIILRDSLLKTDILNRTSTLDKKYQTAEKDKEIAENKLLINKKQHEIQNRNLWIGIVATGTLALALLTAFLYSRFLISKNKQRSQEEQLGNIEREQEILQLKSMINGEETTRIQISRNLHDGIGGQMASLTMLLSMIKNKYQSGQPIEHDMQKLSNRLQETAKELRQAAHNLMPDILNRQSLKEVLLHYCEQNSQENLRLELQYDDTIILTKNAELFIYRIVQELVQNIVKHAAADFAAIQLMQTGNVLAITVEDNGKGFDSATEIQNGQGLQSIRSRVEHLNGYMSADAAPLLGATIHIELDCSKLQQL
ncbi:MAG: tetratricopeptide repeat protein [Sphingobacteriales bacterium]|nr:MAG: tetratricopeptide repeat protein [Sphingobacteriales bacterium]